MRNLQTGNAWWNPTPIAPDNNGQSQSCERVQRSGNPEEDRADALKAAEEICDLSALIAVEQLVKDLARAAIALRWTMTEGMERMRLLQKQGLSFALPIYQQGYLYCSHRRKKGIPRQRTYVGNDPERVRRALDEMERGRRYMEEVERIRHLNQGIASAQMHVERLKRALELLAG